MGLSTTQKSELIQRFAPVLFLDPAEGDYPVRPEAFIERSALWSARPPYDSKMQWGDGVGDVRNPLIPRGGISFNPVDPLILEHSDAELWFETAGWARDPGVESETDNRTCNPGIPDNPYQLTIDGPWFYAEVCDTSLMANWFNSPTVRQQVGLDWNGFLEVAGTVHIVCYYFLFPRHLDVRILARADSSLEPAASYEGDWACFCVVTRPVDDLPGNDIPLMAGFSRRRRGASGDYGGEFTQEYMELVPWDQVPAAGGHAGVKVAQGTHNLYSMDSDQGLPGGVRPQWFDFGSGASEPANKIPQDAVESPSGAASGAVTLAKVLVGLAAAGPLGALIGAIAAGAEAVEIHEGVHEEPELEPGDGSPPEWPDDLEDPRDGLQEASASHVIVPQGQEGFIQTLTGAAGAVAVSFWMEDGERTIVDRTQQLFWTDQMVADHGYNGRWGVRCSDDPFNRRAGGKFPEFRLQLLQRLVVVI